MIKLSILIPTIPPRLSLEFPSIVSQLNDQLNGRKDIELIGLCDNFSWTVGEKRNKLLSLASGKFVAFIDDDDEISGDYIEEVVLGIVNNPNAELISFNVKMWAERLIEYEQIKEKIDGGYVLLSNQAAHIYVWNRQFISNHKFPDISFGEDNAWCGALLKKKPDTVHIDKFLYSYQFDPFNSETRNEAPSGE
jgi:glycosyltransferase involved in cell wall biosynthesis